MKKGKSHIVRRVAIPYKGKYVASTSSTKDEKKDNDGKLNYGKKKVEDATQYLGLTRIHLK